MASVRKKHVVIVDDDVDAAQELRALLLGHGFTVDTVENGRAALDLLMQNPTTEPALMLLDLGMPVMDGWELLAIMRSYSRLRNIPVVLVTGQTVDDHSRTIVDGLFSKPVEPDALLGTVRVICGVLGAS